MTKTEKQPEVQTPATPKLDDTMLAAALDKMNAGEVDFPYTLDLPEELENGVTKLVFRKPKGRDWAKWGDVESEAERLHGLLADLAGVDVEVIGNLDVDEHLQAVAVAKAFFDRYLPPEENGLIKLLLTSPSLTDGLMKAVTNST